jgi:hypothetical protein
MRSKEELLDAYDGPNQGTKREVIRYLYDNPEVEHEPQTVFDRIQDDCPANTADTVANQLSALATEHDNIEHQTRSFYQWAGDGRRRPNRRLRSTIESGREWVGSLGISYGTGVLAFVTWALGILCALVSLIPLFTSLQPLGADFIVWFFWAGLMTILGSTAVMVWVPLYLLDVRTA